jgi:hypothetical protein
MLALLTARRRDGRVDLRTPSMERVRKVELCALFGGRYEGEGTRRYGKITA